MNSGSWQAAAEIETPPKFQAAIGGHPLVAQTLLRRGYQDLPAARAFLDPQAYTPAPPQELPDLIIAVERLWQALQSGEGICVWGDFDVDGQTATTLLVSGLRDLGAKVRYHIPVRARESHGIQVTHLAQILGIADESEVVPLRVLLTCDTGISAHEAVEYARQHGVDTLISDHHDLPESLPEALAVINPKRLPAEHPLANLPGVGVAYKLVEGLYRRAGRPQDSEQFLDLVALGIVADVAEQTGDTRYLLQRGLQKLRANRRLGLRVMLELAELSPLNLSEEHIAFELAPRLNALGRLGDANPVVELLTTADETRARILALELQGLNARRKLLTDQVFQAALGQLAADESLLDSAALVLAHPAWPAGVIGIVASRLVERFHKPVVLIATPPGELGRGSARSVPGVNISAAIASQQELLDGFGGHPMAAGLAIPADNIPAFRRGLSATVSAMVSAAPPTPPLVLDGNLALDELSLELVADFERLAPFGPGNPPLVLVSQNLIVSSTVTLGREGEHLQVTVEDEHGHTHRVLWWQAAGLELPGGRFDLAYSVRTSTFGGQHALQVEWVDFKPRAGAVPVVEPATPTAEVRDYRGQPQPLSILQDLLRQEASWQIWREAEDAGRLKGADRYALAPCEGLVIWTAPPGRRELQAALERSKPIRVALFGLDPGLDELKPFLSRLAGLVKYILGQPGGQTHLADLAAATAQREATVHKGLAWMAARGLIHMDAQADTLVITRGDGQSQPDLEQRMAQLKAALDETAAYRAYFARSAVEGLEIL